MTTYWRDIIADCLLLSLVVFPTLTTAQEELRIDRQGWGQGSSWTELTSLETDVLNQLQTRQRGGSVSAADDLLALYLLASGDVRDRHRFATLQEHVTRFVSDNRSLREIRDPRQRGDSLLRLMHSAFLHNGYEAEQSALSALLSTGVYNCISSALLYLVLATHFDLPASGVIMPSHAFVQLTLDGGDVVEVETTSADGFDVLRDPRFFAEEAQTWFAERRLVVASYADYEQRRVVSAAALGYENMWSQHVSEARMPYADRVRMAELKGMLQADDIDAQHNRLIYYYREADYLQQHDQPLYQTLMNRIEPFLARWEAMALAGLPQQVRPEETLLPLLLLQGQRAQWLVANDQLPRGHTLARQIVLSAPASLAEIDVVRETAFQAIAMTLRSFQAQQQFDRLNDVIAGLESYCAQSLRCISAIAQYYGAHAQHFWHQREWYRVIAIYNEYLALGHDTANTAVFRSNLESAYLNSFRQHWYDEERDDAVMQLEICVIRLPQAAACQEQLQTTRQTRQ